MGAAAHGFDEAQPAHGLPRREAVRPHHAEGDERPRPPQPRLAVHRHDARGGVGDAKEGGDDVARRVRAVLEEEVVVADAGGGEGSGVVLGLVEADHVGYAHLPEHLCVKGWREPAGPQPHVVLVSHPVEVP